MFYQIKETIFKRKHSYENSQSPGDASKKTAKRDTEIQHLKTIELQREIEERKKTELALEELAAIDLLTKVLQNRRKFFSLAEIEVQNALCRLQQPLSAILLDFDQFKAINDNYGHAIGDQVLSTVAQLIRDNLRKGEIVGRIGGDELKILLPGSDLPNAQLIAQRLQEKGSFSNLSRII